jgi:medium-chain acyl-[acyl-carrier-protein] hydrolase
MTVLNHSRSAVFVPGRRGDGRAVQVSGSANPDYTLVCFHHAGGGAAAYRDWLASPPVGARVCAVRLPGRESRLGERPHTDMDAVVAEITDVLAPFLAGRTAFYGHSMGALTAFEITCRLAERGQRLPDQLFLGSCEAPDSYPRQPSFPADWTLDDVRAVLRRLGGTPPELLDHRSLLSVLAPTLVADFGVCEKYVPRRGARVPVPVTVFAGLADPAVSTRAAIRWSAFTSAGFRLRLVRAGHMFPPAVLRAALVTIADAMS